MKWLTVKGALSEWRFATMGGLLLVVLLTSGCAANPGVSGSDALQPSSIDSPEAENRRRAAVRLELAAGYLDQGKPEIALDEVNMALALDPRYVDALVLRGIVYFRLNDLASAEQSYRRALGMDATNGSALHNLGLLYCQQRKFVEAQGFFQRALAAPKYKDLVNTWVTKGVCEIRAGRVAEANNSLLHAFELDPTHPIATFNLGRISYDQRDYVRAQFYIARLNAGAFANAESLQLGVLIERRLGYAEKAKQLHALLRQRFPNSSQLARLDRGDFND